MFISHGKKTTTKTKTIFFGSIDILVIKTKTKLLKDQTFLIKTKTNGLVNLIKY